MARDTLTKRMLKIQRSALNMMLDTMSSIQEKSGQAALAFFEHLSRLPQENVKTMTRWMNSVKVTRADFNSIMRDNYRNWDNMLGQTARHVGQTSQSFGKLKEKGSKKASPQSPPAQGHAEVAAQSPAKPEETGSKEALAPSPPPPEPSTQSSPAHGHAEEAAKSPAKPKQKGSKKAFDQPPQPAGHAAEATPVPVKPGKKASKKGSGKTATQSRKSGKKPPKKG